MWNKIAQLAINLGCQYVENKGVDGVLEDCKRIAELFSSKTSQGEMNDDLLDKWHEYVECICDEVDSNIQQLEELDINEYEDYLEFRNLMLISKDLVIPELNNMTSLVEDGILPDAMFPDSERLQGLSNDLNRIICEKCCGSNSDLQWITNEECKGHLKFGKNSIKAKIGFAFPWDSVSERLLIVVKVEQGVIKEDNELWINDVYHVKVDMISMFGVTLEQAEAGDLAALLVSFLDSCFQTTDYNELRIISCGISPSTIFATKEEFDEDLINEDHTEMGRSSLTQEEQEYLNEYVSCSSDCVSDRERRLLDKLAKSLGISKERMKELEESCKQPTLNEEEHEYADGLKDFLVDGEMSERERHLLDKLRKSLGISEERARQIEAMYQHPSFSEEEQEYADELKAVLADGVISDRERKLLNKLRKSIGLSEGRAEQIEMILRCKSI